MDLSTHCRLIIVLCTSFRLHAAVVPWAYGVFLQHWEITLPDHWLQWVDCTKTWVLWFHTVDITPGFIIKENMLVTLNPEINGILSSHEGCLNACQHRGPCKRGEKHANMGLMKAFVRGCYPGTDIKLPSLVWPPIVLTKDWFLLAETGRQASGRNMLFMTNIWKSPFESHSEKRWPWYTREA